MKSFCVEYVGDATVDKRLSSPMIPWVIAQIRRGTKNKTVKVQIDDGVLRCWEEGGSGVKREVHSHPLLQVSRLTITPTTMFYSVRREAEPQLLSCHLYQSNDPEQIMEMVGQLREQSSRLTSQTGGQSAGHQMSKSSSNSTSLCPDISPSSSQFFEVLYIGKIKVSHKKVPDSFIDDALDKFSHLERMRKQKEFSHSLESEDEALVGRSPAVARCGSTDTLSEAAVAPELPQKTLVRKRSGSAGSYLLIKKPETLELAACAVGTPSPPVYQDDHNRTMVFHVGRSDLRLISPDRKQVLLHKYIKDIISCLQGMRHGSHFAFICRESGIEQPHYIGYVFKCESASIATDVVNAICQALGCGKNNGGKVVHHGPVMSCEHCPLVWYHKLCHDLELSNHDISAQVKAVMRRVEMLPEDEQAVVETKLAGAAALDPSTSREQLELLMMLLRAHCEAKQASHVHDTPQARHEFLNHYLGGGAIFMKAKRSLTNSFDQLLKRKGSRDDLAPVLKVLSLATNSNVPRDEVVHTPGSNSEDNSDSEEKSAGPMKNIFMKVGHSGGLSNGGYRSETESDEEERPVASWRQAIFNTVITPSKHQLVVKKDKEYFRSLWKKAINQQVLLIRMDRENARLTARQEEANAKRIKLEYDDLGCKESSPVWDMVANKDLAHPVDQKLLMHALRQGIPRSKRGEVWICLAERFAARCPPVNTDNFPNFNVPYEHLLKQLTSHQHAILIDLGRTFPSHKYFSSPLGPGQLALFNLLKAYSLLDPEVGYCQGLSFIAAVLLLHMSEEESFYLLKEVMFVRRLRCRYLPGMSALQVQLYQLSRLLLEELPQLHKHFDKHDVSPTLYAAPWLLTLFASQFPLGFVARVFDLMLADSPDVLFKIALALLGQHKDRLLKCHSFESIMDYLKKDLPVVNAQVMDNIVVEVLSKDIGKELTEYGVEYHVLQEEMSSPRPEAKRIKQLELTNKNLEASNKALAEQLQIATSNINRLESSRSSHLAEINKLESQVKNLETTVALLGEFISTVTYGNSDIEKPEEVTRVLNSLSRKENGKRAVNSAPLRVIQDHDVPQPRKDSTNLSQRVSNLFRNNSQTEQIENKIGRTLSEKEKEGLLSRLKGNNIKRDSSDTSTKPILKSSQSSIELPTNSLPLETNGVHISYEGTTKLKTIRPLRSRNTLNTIPLLTDKQSQVQLKIIEKDDEIKNKIKATMSKVTNLFDTDRCLDKNNAMTNDKVSI